MSRFKTAWLHAMIVVLVLSASCADNEKAADGEEVSSVDSQKPHIRKSGLQLVIMGPPGAGKGTQAKRISDKYGIAHISTGDMLRAEVARGSELGSRVKAIMDRGELVADEIVLELVRTRIDESDCERGFILDGFPRTIPQATGLAAVLEKRGTPAITVIDLAVTEDELMRRMLARRRADDTEATIRNRIAVYHRQTAPLIEFYEGRGTLVRVNGNQSIESVFEEIDRVLSKM